MLRKRKLATTTQKQFHVVIEKGEDGYYIATTIELPGCHTQAKNLKELDKRIKEAIQVYLEAEGIDSTTLPEFIAVKKVKV